MKIWRPNRCGCSIELTDDWKEGKSILKTCSAHSAITDAKELHAVLLEESRRAMDVLRRIETEMPNAFNITRDVNGDIVGREFKPGKNVDFEYSDDRVLTVRLIGFNTAERNAANLLASQVANINRPIRVE